MKESGQILAQDNALGSLEQVSSCLAAPVKTASVGGVFHYNNINV